MTVYLAPILVLLLCTLGVYGWVVRNLEKQVSEKYSYKMPVFLQAPVLIYVMFMWVFLDLVYSMVSYVLIPSKMLDPLTTEALVNHTMFAIDHEGEGTYTLWKKEASLEDYDMLRWFSMSGPLWCLGTWCVTAYHTWVHLEVLNRTGRLFSDCPQRTRTLCILALPMVYGIMALKSVQRTWDIVIDHIGSIDAHIYHSWAQRKTLCEQMFASNFMVGDLYESFALWMFSFVVTDVIKVEMFHLMPARDGSWRTVSSLVDAMRDLTTDGVKLFYISCVFNSIYLLVVSTLRWFQYFNVTWLRETLDNEQLNLKADSFFLGLGFAASFAAIGNLIKVESSFDHHLKSFRSRSKFWGTKILVTLAFLQSLLLCIPPLRELSVTRQNMIYASVLCVECFFISVLHAVAWPADEAWYDEVADDVCVERLQVVLKWEEAFGLKQTLGPSDSHLVPLVAEM